MLHAQLGRIETAIPIDAVALALGIEEVRRAALDSCEGLLLTDKVRSRGRILVNDRYGERRARFSIAHELGHFLLEDHVLGTPEGFRCRDTDMREGGDDTRHQHQEREANRFAIDFLAPTHLVAPFLARAPDINHAVEMRTLLNISLEAAVRCMIDRSHHTLAAVWSHGDHVRYVVRTRTFPRLKPWGGCQLPIGTSAWWAIAENVARVTRMAPCQAAAWVEAPDVEIFEQSRIGRDGHAVTLLWASLPDSDEDEETEGHCIGALGEPHKR